MSKKSRREEPDEEFTTASTMVGMTVNGLAVRGIPLLVILAALSEAFVEVMHTMARVDHTATGTTTTAYKVCREMVELITEELEARKHGLPTVAPTVRRGGVH